VPLGFMFVFTAIYLNFDKILISMIKGDFDTGLYGAAYKLSDYLKMMTGLYFPIIFPALSHLSKESISGRFSRLIEKSFYLLLMVTLPISIGTTVLSDRFVVLFFGKEFIASAGALGWLIWILPFGALSGLFGYSLISIGKQHLCGIATFAGLVVNIILNLILIPKYGFIGAAYSILMAEILVALIVLYFNEIHLKVRFDKASVVKLMVAAFIMFILTYSLRGKSLYLVIPISAAVYVAVLWVLKLIKPADWMLIREAFLKKEGVTEIVEYEQI
jgi:O-antigen/teichoic acid export membrane protein